MKCCNVEPGGMIETNDLRTCAKCGRDLLITHSIPLQGKLILYSVNAMYILKEPKVCKKSKRQHNRSRS